LWRLQKTNQALGPPWQPSPGGRFQFPSAIGRRKAHMLLRGQSTADWVINPRIENPFHWALGCCPAMSRSDAVRHATIGPPGPVGASSQSKIFKYPQFTVFAQTSPAKGLPAMSFQAKAYFPRPYAGRAPSRERCFQLQAGVQCSALAAENSAGRQRNRAPFVPRLH